MIRKNFFLNKWCTQLAKLGLVLAIIGPFAACNGSDEDDLVGDWVKISSFSGVPRSSAVAAVLDGEAYVGTGYNINTKERLKDFWSYDGTSWSQVAAFGGDARTNAVAFTADGKLYVGTGFNGTNGTKQKDFWAYDPEANTWVEVASLATDNVNSPELLGREGMVAFSINDIGYVGTGVDKDGVEYNDFYAYDPSTDSWSQITDFLGEKRQDAVAFVINNIAYVCTGTNNSSYSSELSSYNPETNAWTRLRSIEDKSDESYDDDYSIARNQAVAFTMGGKAYIATGGKNAAGSDVWEYNPSTDLWTEKTPFEGAARFNAVAFTVGDVGYVLTGQQGSSAYFDDVWTFYPNAEFDDTTY
ncbi:MAG: Kelch repeat-containing protein [Mangrovibacterium sp.]